MKFYYKDQLIRTSKTHAYTTKHEIDDLVTVVHIIREEATT